MNFYAYYLMFIQTITSELIAHSPPLVQQRMLKRDAVRVSLYNYLWRTVSHA